MTDVAKVQAEKNLKFAAGMSSLRQGTCISIDWVAGTALVNIPGASLPMPMVGGAPIPNARCWVGFLGNKPICLGAVTRPPLATVSGTASGGLITVTGDDGVDYPVTFTTGASFSSGDRVLIDWTFGTIVAVPEADPNTGNPINTGPESGGGGPQSRTFYPVASGTWRDGTYASGWVGGDVLCSDHNHGAYFYQGVADTIPPGALNLQMSVYMPSLGGYGDAPTLGGHALAGMSGDLVITGPRAFSAGWVPLNDLAASFNSGGLLGVGTNGGGNWRFAAAGVDNAGALGATWST